MSESQIHNRVIKSTSIIGGSSLLNVLFRIIQAKLAALLLGPPGVGLMVVLNSVLALASLIAGMGLDTSGVRQIAEAAGSENEERIARTIITYRRIAFLFGLIGAGLFFILRYPIAQLTFGDAQHATTLGFLAFALFCSVIASAQSTLIRGMRRIGDLAKVSVLGIALGTIIGLPFLYFFRMNGVGPYLVISTIPTLFIAWWFARHITLVEVTVTWRQIWADAKELVSLGFVFMASGLTTLGMAYIINVLITRRLGLEPAGFYGAASAISNVYVGFILGAMGADYFPHLAALSKDNFESNRLINAQIEVGMLAATPGVLLVLALGPFIIQLLYSAEFISTLEILRWQALGTFLRIFSWPLAYLILARGQKSLYFWNELAANLLYLGALIICIEYLGLTGIGIAFFLMYVFYTFSTIVIARRLSGFQWSNNNLKRLAFLLPIVLVTFACSYYLSPLLTGLIGTLFAVGTGLYSLRAIYDLLGPETVNNYVQRIRAKFGQQD